PGRLGRAALAGPRDPPGVHRAAAGRGGRRALRRAPGPAAGAAAAPRRAGGPGEGTAARGAAAGPGRGGAPRPPPRAPGAGPGVRPGRERTVLEPGTRDERAGGLGLGLHVCRTLLAAEDATIEILPADARSPGCEVVLGVPAGEWADPERPRARRERDASPVS